MKIHAETNVLNDQWWAHNRETNFKKLKRESYLSYLLASATQPELYPYIRALTVRAATIYCEDLISFLNLSEDLSKCEFEMWVK